MPFAEADSISVTDTEPLPHLLSHILHDKLGVDPSDHPLMVTEPAWNTPRARETLAEIAFEGEGVPAFYVACNAVLSAYVHWRDIVESLLIMRSALTASRQGSRQL